MKPFVAVLVAASLTAASAAPALQQVAVSSRPGAGQTPLVSGGASRPGGSQLSFGGQSSQPNSLSWSGAPFGGQLSGGAIGGIGAWQSQVPAGGNFWFGGYPGSGYYNPSQGYNPVFYGQNFYGQNYGNGASSAYTPGYGSGSWGFPSNGYGSGYGYYGNVFPVGYGFSSFGSQGVQGPAGAGQLQTSLGGLRVSASGSSSQNPVRRQ